MFRLVKTLHSGQNHPEPMKITLAAAVTAARGTLFTLSEGALVPTKGATNVIPTHILLADAHNESEILCALIPTGAVFAAKVSTDPSDMTVGTEYLISTDAGSITATAATADARGASLLDKSGATKAGDEVLVTFPIR